MNDGVELKWKAQAGKVSAEGGRGRRSTSECKGWHIIEKIRNNETGIKRLGNSRLHPTASTLVTERKAWQPAENEYIHYTTNHFDVADGLNHYSNIFLSPHRPFPPSHVRKRIHYFGISSNCKLSQGKKVKLWGVCQTLVHRFFCTKQVPNLQ